MMHQVQLVIERQGAGTPTVARVVGDVGVAQVERLNTLLRGLLEIRPSCIILDLSETSNVGSMALGSLVQFHKLGKTAGVRVRIAAPSQTALQGILLARLDTIFDVFATLDDALASEGDVVNGPVRVVTRPPTGVWGQQTSGDWPVIGPSAGGNL
jgi:anti-anti-sigma factor